MEIEVAYFLAWYQSLGLGIVFLPIYVRFRQERYMLHISEQIIKLIDMKGKTNL